MSFTTPNDNESECEPVDAKLLRLVPYMAGVDLRRSLSLPECSWDEKSDMGDCLSRESQHRHGLAQRSGEGSGFHRINISAGVHEPDSSKSCIPPIDPTDLLGNSFTGE